MTETDARALRAIAQEVYDNATAHGFHEGEKIGEVPRYFGDWTSNLHSEASELWEAYRKGKLFKESEKPGLSLTYAEEELADIIIRAMDTAVALGVDIGGAVFAKAAYNRTRPYRHGGKKA